MRRNLLKSVTHRTVRHRKPAQNISQEPEMIELKRIYLDMTDEERERTTTHLEDAKNITIRRDRRMAGTDTVHYHLLDAQSELAFVSNAIYRFGAQGDYMDGNPAEMLIGASKILDRIWDQINRITSCEVAIDLELPETQDEGGQR